MKMMQPIQHSEALGCLPHLLAQLAGPVVGVSHIWSRLALGSNQGLPEGNLQVQLLLGASRSIWQNLEHLQSFRKVANGFYMRRALARTLASPLPVGNRVLR